ncbi:uncharacterized protein Z519_01497 [Cladophialophora bantiana CBS 173.52]|uniref:Uncharacterized protein n=1 Tax=Cladophialophora bantiana (strain ATCC 10958 / CBS 173.52 / CDC B-1940 / NIH 8579) TaxID=1442370 RepID=A0A0D2HX03_CLAB1|nr:uncharacterized protein Z519_01497 [Cladophialophora bantiana CBS 173.52]KIW97913.1 hypothetical protein Z519_01497 [Cladophialophora bantiana CBS 173.52]
MANVITNSANRPQMTPLHRRTCAARVPIIITDGEAKQRDRQTENSERARDEVLRQGIKVRDFQVEADARRYERSYASYRGARGVSEPGCEQE